MRGRALAIIKGAKQASQLGQVPPLDFIGLMLRGKKVSFEKVITMIDEMVETLKKEQADDDKKKEYCDAEFDESDDKKKELELDIADTEKAIAETEEGLATTADEIKALEDGIKA